MHNGWYPATTTDPHSSATFECLNMFHLLNVTANMNIRDYVTFLKQSTDAYNTEWIPDQYKAFGRMSRQWAYLKRLKRVGIGHLKEGLDSVELGSVAIRCWACPREGVNLPPEWADVADEEQYMFCSCDIYIHSFWPYQIFVPAVYWSGHKFSFEEQASMQESLETGLASLQWSGVSSTLKGLL